jgi:pimeloyl-ACP methyl ester carboxylesterase/DNA-binding CsgD family transcriptional regulator
MPYPIRYARTDDRVNIAFCELGEGEPLIYLTALPWCNFSVGFSNPQTIRHQEEVAEAVRLIVYDARGCGLSDHDAADLTLDGFVRDIDAVADAAGHDRFAIYGSADASRVMIHYAVMRPERVTRLILWVPSVSSARLREDAGLRSVTSLADRDWELYLRTLSHAVVGGWDAERAPYAAAFADMMRGSIRPDEFVRFRTAMRTHDVTADLGAVQAPTLVLGREDVMAYTVPVVREVAAGIPSAQLVVSPGNWLLPCTGDDVTREVVRFMHRQDAALPETPVRSVGRGEQVASQMDRTDHDARLSPRELEVLTLLSHGKTNAEIADVLFVAPATASRHVHNILNKLGMSRRAEAAAYAARRGFAEERVRG